MGHFTLPLDSLDSNLETAGGKGANLGRLIRGGFPVPPGFVVTTQAYRTLVRANALGPRIAELAEATRVDDPESFESASEAIRQLFDRCIVPPEIAEPIATAYRDLALALAPTPLHPNLPVAVRSSATAEDLADASFAGQQETYLNVCGEQALMDAVLRCWSSLWTARAMAYRARKNIPPSSVALAVVVQVMAPADAAGILFTVNPVTGSRDEMLVNAAWGLGEAIVAGQVNPDSLVVDKRSGRVKSLEIGDKRLMTAPQAEGTAEVPVDESRRRAQVLTPEHAAELARLGREIEASLGGPQDIEWAVSGGRIHILQSRPVTTLPLPGAERGAGGEVPGDDDWPPSNGRPHSYDLWTQADVGERWPEPVTPLTWSTSQPIMNESMRESHRATRAPYLDEMQWARRQYGRVYFNEGAMAHLMSQEYGMPSAMAAAAMGSQAGESVGATGWRWGTILRRLPLFLHLMFKWMRDEKKFMARFPEIDRRVNEFMAWDLTPVADAALWAEANTVWMLRVMESMNFHAEITAMSFQSFPMLEALAARWLGSKEVTNDLVNGLTGVLASEIVPSLWAMARRAGELGLASVLLENEPKAALDRLRETAEAAPVLKMLDEFLQRHGHRCGTEAEWLYPRWIEAPELVIESLAGYLRAGEHAHLDDAEARQRRRREEVLARLEVRLDPIRKAYFRSVLGRTQHLVRLRDNGQHYLVKLLLPVRHIYAVLGERWASRGWLEAPEDFFFLVVPEIERVLAAGSPDAAGLDLRPAVAERRKAYRHWFGVTAPEVLDASGEPMSLAASANGSASGDALAGIAASAGRASGTARVVANPREAARLRPGEILVTRATDPGWTPVFSLIGGIVLEVGGQLSHGAIVAREYGIPAVVNVPDATRRISDGQAVTVDGTAGRVHLSVP